MRLCFAFVNSRQVKSSILLIAVASSLGSNAATFRYRLYRFIQDPEIRKAALDSIAEATDYRSAVYGALAMLRTVYIEMQANLNSARENEHNAKDAYDVDMYSKRVLLLRFKVRCPDLFSNEES